MSVVHFCRRFFLVVCLWSLDMRVALPSIKFDIQLNWWVLLVFVLWCLFPFFMEFMLYLVTLLWFVLFPSHCFLLHVNIVSMFIVRCHCAVFCKHLSTGTFVLHLLVAFAYIFFLQTVYNMLLFVNTCVSFISWIVMCVTCCLAFRGRRPNGT